MSSLDHNNSAANSVASREGLEQIGQILREARQSRGEDLYDIAEFLRIRPSYLFALEDGDMSMTPGRVYALGFMRSYGEYLGFDGDELVRHVREALDGVAPGPELHYRMPLAENRRPSAFILGASIALMAILYGSWYAYNRDGPVLNSVTSVPGEIGKAASGLFHLAKQPSPAAPNGGSGPSVATTKKPPQADTRNPTGPSTVAALVAPDPAVIPAAATSTTPPGPTPADHRSAAGSDAGPSTIRPSEVASVSSALAAEPASPAAARSMAATDAKTGAAAAAATGGSAQALLASLESGTAAQQQDATTAPASGQADVVLVAHQKSWIQVRSKNHDYVQTTTLEPGDRFAVPNRDDLALWTGNAGGLEVLVNGKSIGVLGAPGGVLHDVRLTPGALKTRLASR